MYSIYFYIIYILRSRNFEFAVEKGILSSGNDRDNVDDCLRPVRDNHYQYTDTIVDPVDLAVFEIIPCCLSHSLCVYFASR